MASLARIGFAVVLGVGCAPSPSAAPPASVESAATPAPAAATHAVTSAAPPGTPAPEAPALAACRKLAQEHAAALRPVYEAYRQEKQGDVPREHQSPCWPDARGAWSVAYGRIAATPSGERVAYGTPHVTGEYSLVRVDTNGTHTATEPVRPYVSFLRATSFDWDGDGVPELAVQESVRGPLRIVTARDGAVVQYAPARRVSALAVEDVDRDGRPDLLLVEPFGAVLERDGYPVHTYEVDVPGRGPWLMAHSLPDGTFSRDDGAAREFAARTCASGSLPPLTPEETEYIRPAMAIRCARLWGRSTADLDRFVTQVCKLNPLCPNQAVLRAWARVKPPFVLTDADLPP